MPDFLFRGSLEKLDPDVYELTQLEQERQARKLILIASESTAPLAVREALSSAFQNIYAEGYPDEESRWMTEEEILDYPTRLAHYRRDSDPRYYKGVEYADVVEALARRRAAETFAANGYSADQIYVNVQALSGGPANNAVYHALIELGSTVMGLNLLHGGHLSHGSSVNRSGKWFKAVHYTIGENERLDYEAIRKLANEHKPKLMIAGYSSYSWMPDWKKFREIADEVGAYFLADISHIGGLVAAGVVPSPIGHAHVVMSTTHKSIDGPRGAVLLTTDASIAKKLDKAVFPGEQGGPHVNVFAALALTFKLTQTKQFKKLQEQTIKNAKAMADQFTKRGLRVPFGGTDTHLVNVDCTSIVGEDGTKLSGDQASRILDIVGVVVNRNTIPGDKNSMDPSGIRLGTPWISQRGFDEKKTRELANVMADVLLACAPHSVDTVRKGKQRRAKLDFNTLNVARLKVRKLAESAGIDFKYKKSGYPHFYFIDDTVERIDNPLKKGRDTIPPHVVYELSGDRVRQVLDYAVSADVSALMKGKIQATEISTPKGKVKGTLKNADNKTYQLSVPVKNASVVAAWLRDLSDGYVSFNLDGSKDFSAKRMPGPFVMMEAKRPSPHASRSPEGRGGSAGVEKPFYIGISSPVEKEALPPFAWNESEGDPSTSSGHGLKKTTLNQTHRDLGGRMVPFAGWEMPVQYSGIFEEHLATRNAAGLFDVSHMGVYDVRGADAAAFLDAVCGNDCGGLMPGESLYTHFLTPDADVIDDTLVYRRGWDDYLVVVNASNDDKDRTWLESVRDGTVRIDSVRPWARTFGYNAVIRNLRDPKSSEDMRVDIALQGPKSRDVLLAMGVDTETRIQVNKLKRTELCNAVVGGFDLIVSRTGYTGEKMAFELFVHPERAVDFWNAVLKAGEPFGVKPIGLGARDSLRTEAGLPLYGHEMGLGSGKSGLDTPAATNASSYTTSRDLGVAEGGFGSYVKTYKPWFIGRDAYVAREKERKGVVIRFTFDEQRVRMAHNGDPVVNANGERIGFVTSCAIDGQRFITGQAYVDLKYTKEGTPIGIHQGGNMERPAGMAKVVSRFGKL